MSDEGGEQKVKGVLFEPIQKGVAVAQHNTWLGSSLSLIPFLAW
jgi:hypothetical protein